MPIRTSFFRGSSSGKVLRETIDWSAIKKYDGYLPMNFHDPIKKHVTPKAVNSKLKPEPFKLTKLGSRASSRYFNDWKNRYERNKSQNCRQNDPKDTENHQN